MDLQEMLDRAATGTAHVEGGWGRGPGNLRRTRRRARLRRAAGAADHRPAAAAAEPDGQLRRAGRAGRGRGRRDGPACGVERHPGPGADAPGGQAGCRGARGLRRAA
nr:hypothetical protein [Janibacter limosus]